MVGYAVLLVSFPVEMTRWPVPGPEWDAVTGATALDALRTGLAQSYTMQEILADPAFGRVGAAGGEWLNLAALLGGTYLLLRRVIRWQIPLAMLAGLAAACRGDARDRPRCARRRAVPSRLGRDDARRLLHRDRPRFRGDQHRGRLYFGAGIGVLTWIIRSWGGYPDGVAFAVLLMNLAVPLLDRYTVPRIHGHRGR